MTETTTTETHTVGSGTATVTYDVHGDLTQATPDRPALLMIGSPMDAVGFTTLRSHFTDRPVVTYDPRGAGRNPTDTTSITVEEHADDLHRVIEAVGAGPVDVFASSGGAVNVLALAANHPEDVRRVVAHEPPTAALLPDRDVGPGDLPGHARDLRRRWQRTRHGEVHLVRDVRRPGARRLPGPAGAGPGDVRDVERRRRIAHRPADAQHAGLQRPTSPTSRRSRLSGTA